MMNAVMMNEVSTVILVFHSSFIVHPSVFLRRLRWSARHANPGREVFGAGSAGRSPAGGRPGADCRWYIPRRGAGGAGPTRGALPRTGHARRVRGVDLCTPPDP